MKRFAAALILTLALAAPASATDRLVSLTLDGRPVDRTGGIALLHQGVVYADVVDLVKSFNGLITFQGPASVVTVNSVNVRFLPGQRTVKINDETVTMKGAPFLRNGDLYVPLETFVTQVAKAKLKVDTTHAKADIVVNSPVG